MNTTIHVLLIQHPAALSAQTVDALEAAGMSVEAERVETGEQMRAALERRAWDVIVSDLRLPAFSALEALHLLGFMGLDVPLVVMAERVGEEGAVELMRAGARDCLVGEVPARLARMAIAVRREAAASRRTGAGRQLAGSVGHDLNNLLQVVQGYGQLALDVLPPGGEARPNLDEVLRAVEKARSLVLKLLAFSREGGASRSRTDAEDHREDAENHRDAPGSQRGPSVEGTESILLAQHDESVRGFTLSVLKGAGYRVHAASNGEEAMSFFQACGGDVRLAIVDAILPRIGGKLLAERLRGIRPRLPVLISTGYPFGLIQEGFVPSPDMDVIHKPFTHVELLRRVRDLIDLGKEA